MKEKLQKIKQEGLSNLHVIADFDGTLTMKTVAGSRTPTSIGQMRESGVLGEDYTRKGYELYDQYHVFEIDPTLAYDEKSKKMDEWWEKHLELMIQYGMSRQALQRAIEKSNMVLRQGVTEFFDFLKQNHVPILIFSAGIGDIVKAALGKLADYENVHIISNFCDFDKQGKLIGYKNTTVHSFNKNEEHIKGTDYYHEIKDRENVILLGDSIGDSEMAAGVEHKTVLKIGFLNGKKHLKDTYSNIYDLIIQEDRDFSEVNQIFKQLV